MSIDWNKPIRWYGEPATHIAHNEVDAWVHDKYGVNKLAKIAAISNAPEPPPPKLPVLEVDIYRYPERDGTHMTQQARPPGAPDSGSNWCRVRIDPDAEEREKRLREMLHTAWCLICNAGGGNWVLEAVQWRKAAERFRDEYHDALAEARRIAGEAKA